MKISNLNTNFYLSCNYYVFCFYKYNKNNKNVFIKTINLKLKNFKTLSIYREKNVTIVNKFFKNSVFNGKKESFFKYFNNFLKIFFFLFSTQKNDFNEYKNYLNIYNLLKKNKFYFDFEFLLGEFIHIYYSLFDIKMIKPPKKNKTKKLKLNYEIQYIFKEKRLKFILKLINNFLKKKNTLNLSKKLFWLFVEILFDPYNSFLWERKSSIYNKILKKFFNKKIIKLN